MWAKRCCCSDPEDPPCAGFFAGNKTYARVSFTIAHGLSSSYVETRSTGELDGSSCAIAYTDQTRSQSSSESFTGSITAVISYRVLGSSRAAAYVAGLGGSGATVSIVSTSSSFTGTASHSKTTTNFNSSGDCTSKVVETLSGSLTKTGDNTGSFGPTDYTITEASAPTSTADLLCALQKCRILTAFDDIGVNYSYSGTGSRITYGGQECDDEEDDESIGANGTATWTPSGSFATVGGATDCTDQASTIPSLPIDYGTSWSIIKPLSLTATDVSCPDMLAAGGSQLDLTACELHNMLSGASFSKTWRSSESLDAYDTCPGPAPRFVEGETETITTFTSSVSINSITFTDSAP